MTQRLANRHISLHADRALGLALLAAHAGRNGLRSRGRPGPQAEHHLHPVRRPRAGRPGLLRAEADPDAEPGPHGRRGHAVHAGLLRHDRLRAVADLADDRAAHGPLAGPRQPRDPAGGPDAAAGRHVHRGAAAQGPGYATACIGKWGMGMFDTTGSPLKKGFDHFFGYNCQRHAHSYFPTYLYNDDQRFELPGNDGKGVGKTYAQNLIADETLKWVRAQKDRPFFLFYSVTLPHGRFEIDDLGHVRRPAVDAAAEELRGDGHAAGQRRRAAAGPAQGTAARRADAGDVLRRQRLVVPAELGDRPAVRPGRPTACAASSASCTKAGCGRPPSPAGRAWSRPGA